MLGTKATVNVGQPTGWGLEVTSMLTLQDTRDQTKLQPSQIDGPQSQLPKDSTIKVTHSTTEGAQCFIGPATATTGNTNPQGRGILVRGPQHPSLPPSTSYLLSTQAPALLAPYSLPTLPSLPCTPVCKKMQH